MKTSLALLFGLLLFPKLSHGGIENEIPKENRVVLPTGAKEPTEEQAQKALVAIQSFLENPGQLNEHQLEAIKKIRANAKSYRVQFFSEEVDGKNVIWCNFFPAAEKGKSDHFEYWRKSQVLVSDGGAAYWNITFDPSTGKCIKFRTNGEA